MYRKAAFGSFFIFIHHIHARGFHGGDGFIKRDMMAAITAQCKALKDFGETIVKIPSIKEQNKIAEVLIAADKEIELLKQELKELKLQKKGLMQNLLTGKVRVKV